MKRRDFLQSGFRVSVSLAFAKTAPLFSQATAVERWRTFQVTTRVEVLNPSGTTRIWVPAALTSETPFQKTISKTFNCEGGTATSVESKSDTLGIIAAEFPAGVKPILTVTSQIRTRDYAVDFADPGKVPKRTAENCNIFCGQPSFYRPTAS
jgi:hypothetical protein